MTLEEINRIKYMVCCPMCDNDKCVRNTDKCEAEIWAKNKAEGSGEGWTKEQAIGNLIHAIRWNDMPKKETFYMAIQALAQEPKTGHWIVHPNGIYAHLICDKCLSSAPYGCRTNYCPNCGAKMEEVQNDSAEKR